MTSMMMVTESRVRSQKCMYPMMLTMIRHRQKHVTSTALGATMRNAMITTITAIVEERLRIASTLTALYCS